MASLAAATNVAVYFSANSDLPGKRANPAAPKTLTTPPTTIKDQRDRSTGDFLAQFRVTIEGGNNTKVAQFIDYGSSCRECIRDLITAYDANRDDKTFIIHASKILLQSGQREAIAVVLRALLEADGVKNFALKDELLQVIAALNNVESVRLVAELLAGRDASIGYFPDRLSADTKYALQKALREVPEASEVGRVLIEQYRNETATEKENLLAIGHVGMNLSLALDTWQRGDEAQAQVHKDAIVSSNNPRTVLDILAFPVVNPSQLPFVADLLYSWVRNHPYPYVQEQLIEYLTGHESTEKERALAGYALSSIGSAAANSALQKALLNENNPLVLSYLKAASNTANVKPKQ